MLLDASHLSLLQHDLAHQHGVRVVDVTPGQVAMQPSALAAHKLHELVAPERLGRPRNRAGTRYAHDSHALASSASGASAAMRGVGAAHCAAQRTAAGTASASFAFAIAASTTGCDAPCSMRSLSVIAPK